jgi:hypothetical protein
LWKGRIDSQGAVDEVPDWGNGEKVAVVGLAVGWGRDWQGQASPRGMSLIVVREGGQIDIKPSIRTFHRTGSGTIGIEVACVEGCESKYSGAYS